MKTPHVRYSMDSQKTTECLRICQGTLSIW